jgi:hypothetical protein
LLLAAGILSPTLWFKCVGRSIGFLWIERPSGRVEKLVHHPETKNPACFAGEQGSRKVDDLCEILNYLPASFVGSSFAELGRVSVASRQYPKPDLPMRKDIPAQRNHSVACECFGYVLDEVIGFECGICLSLPS